MTETAHLTEVGYGVSKACHDYVGFIFASELPPYRIGYADPPFTECRLGHVVETSGWNASSFVLFRSTGSANDMPFRSATDAAPFQDPRAAVRHVREICAVGGKVEWLIGLDKLRPFRASAQQVDQGAFGVFIEFGDN